MEHNAPGNTSAPDGIPQCGDGKEPIDPPAHPAGDDLSGIQVQDRADITEPTTHRDIGKIANPDHIGCRLPGRASALVVSRYSFWGDSSVSSAGTLDLH